MSPSHDEASKEDKALSSAGRGKVRQNPQPRRNQPSPGIRPDKEEPKGGAS
jgi:hypothetical protein